MSESERVPESPPSHACVQNPPILPNASFPANLQYFHRPASIHQGIMPKRRIVAVLRPLPPVASVFVIGPLHILLLLLCLGFPASTAFHLHPPPSLLPSSPSSAMHLPRAPSSRSYHPCPGGGGRPQTLKLASPGDADDPSPPSFPKLLRDMFGRQNRVTAKRAPASSTRPPSSSRPLKVQPPAKKAFPWPPASSRSSSSSSSSSSSPRPQTLPRNTEAGPTSSKSTGFQAPLGNLRPFVSDLTRRLQTPVSLGPALTKLAFLSVGFLGGGASGLLLLLSPSSPLTSLPPSLLQPVTLFENILLEIDRGYVEEVDDQKLFESAVESMLSSLDPYTEFEGEQLAQDMREVGGEGRGEGGR
ncbi:carboxyl-terminal protease, partial [Nannochloropsis gaditana]